MSYQPRNGTALFSGTGTEGREHDLPPLDAEKLDGKEADNELAERVLALAQLQHGGNKACYLLTPDLVFLPNRSAFENSDFYYATGFHEICHWTGTRLG